jgi:histidinol-phosphate aminotransferase
VFGRLAKIDGIKTFRSDANFLFIEAGRNYQPISKALRSSGIVVKMLGNVAGHRGCMRVTIGTREMNDKFLQCVEGSL